MLNQLKEFDKAIYENLITEIKEKRRSSHLVRSLFDSHPILRNSSL